jgi:hypothetical protein
MEAVDAAMARIDEGGALLRPAPAGLAAHQHAEGRVAGSQLICRAPPAG